MLDRAALARAFHKAANMKPAEIVAWARDPRAKRASLPRRKATGRSAIDELSQVARMKRHAPSSWTESDWRKARDLVNFVKRHTAQMGSACQPTRIIALRNWAHQPPRCGVPR
jgi:hypothetical protein